VLIFDDEIVIRDILTRILTEHGYQVDFASSGTEGLDKIRGSPYDAYLLNIKMLVVDGKDMYEIIGSKYPDMVDRVVFITGVYSQQIQSGLPEMHKAGIFRQTA
jgi:DNA-binding response OmpR family regulator